MGVFRKQVFRAFPQNYLELRTCCNIKCVLAAFQSYFRLPEGGIKSAIGSCCMEQIPC